MKKLLLMLLMVSTTQASVIVEDGIEEKVTEIDDQKKIEEIITALLQKELGIDPQYIKIICNGKCRLTIRELYVQKNYNDLDEFKKLNNL